MAERRMISKKVTDDDNFMALSSSAQALYLHLSMNADDDGFCNQISSSMFKSHASIQDLQSLLENRYIYQFDSGVIVIKHWRMANALRKDRYTPTLFQQELSKLELKDTGVYERLPDGCHMVANWLPQDRLGKVRLGKVNTNTSVENESRPDDTTDEHITLPLKDGNTYRVTEDQVKSWRNAFPSVNIPQELRKMCVWSEANPSKQKSRRGIQRFIVNWLSREQEKSEEKRARSLGAAAEYQQDVMPVYDDSKNPTVSQKELDDFFKENAS